MNLVKIPAGSILAGIFICLMFCGAALEAGPASGAEYHYQLANTYAQEHDDLESSGLREEAVEKLEAARLELEQAVMLNPDFIPAHYNLGVIYKNQEEYEKAREQFKAVLEIDPKQANAYMQIGAVYEKQGFYDEAEDAYLKARDLDYHNPAIRSALEDLKEARKESAEKEKQDDLSRLSRLGEQFYQMRQQGQTSYAGLREADAQGNQHIKQAIPFMGAWLLQEMLKRKSQQQ